MPWIPRRAQPEASAAWTEGCFTRSKRRISPGARVALGGIRDRALRAQSMGESDEKDDCGGFCGGDSASARTEHGSGCLLRNSDGQGEEGLPGCRRHVGHVQADLSAALEQIAAR